MKVQRVPRTGMSSLGGNDLFVTLNTCIRRLTETRESLRPFKYDKVSRPREGETVLLT